MENNTEKVLAAMHQAGKPLKAGDIAGMTGIEKDDVNKIIKTLKKDGKIISPKNCFYCPAE